MKRTVSATIPQGAVGVWHLPRFPMFVPLYAPSKTKTIQSIVDDKYSAVYRTLGIGHKIGDHANSVHGAARWRVNEFKLGDKAFLFLSHEIRRYVCTGLFRVKVESASRYTHEGVAIYPRQPADICCTCCVEEGPEENYMAYFRFDGIEEEE